MSKAKGQHPNWLIHVENMEMKIALLLDCSVKPLSPSIPSVMGNLGL